MTVAMVRLRHDELLYSGLARLSRYLLARDTTLVREALFGEATAVFHDLPVGLGRVCSSGVFGPADVDHALHEWTLFPYFARYVNPARAREAARVMEDGGDWPHRVLRSWAVVPSPDRLRYCSSCLKDMLSRHPDPWWVRAHQLPSVLVCPEHREVLMSSSLTRRAACRDLVAAGTSLGGTDGSPLLRDVEPGVMHNLVQLAIASDALLDMQCDTHPDDRRMRYLAALRRLDLLNRAGEAKLGAVAKAMDRYWGRTLDAWPGLSVDGACDQRWLGVLLLSGRDSSPLYHLLLEGMLGGRLRAW